MNFEGIDHVALSVRDVEKSKRWYCDVLGFEHLYAGVWEEPVFVGKGCFAVALFAARGSGPKSSGKRNQLTVLHFAFRASRLEFTSAQAELKEREIDFEFQDHEISHSIYFRDPDGHELEITTYEVNESH